MEREDVMCGETVDAASLGDAVEAFAALAEADRLRLLLALGNDELTANHLADIVQLCPSVVREHLSTLRRIKVVVSKRYGDRPFYRLSNPLIRGLILQYVPASSLAGLAGSAEPEGLETFH